MNYFECDNTLVYYTTKGKKVHFTCEKFKLKNQFFIQYNTWYPEKTKKYEIHAHTNIFKKSVSYSKFYPYLMWKLDISIK